MRLATMLGFTLALAACAEAPQRATDDDPSEEDYADVATSLGTTAAHEGDEVSAMRAAAALARGDVPRGLVRGSDGSYRGTTAGRAYAYTLAAQTATSADVASTWSAGLDLPQLAMTIAHDATWQLTGITPSIAHVDGTGSLTYDTRDDASSFHYRYDATYHVVVDDTRAIGGEIGFEIHGERRAARATHRFAITAQLTFAPDDTAELVLDGTHHYRIALATGIVTDLDALTA
ncbi:MAG TPA: hypothetical protein VFP84_19480 [Kofleriaceae bacterium]|nr:hypothetical protein [Kofleriaceae bacterium]